MPPPPPIPASVDVPPLPPPPFDINMPVDITESSNDRPPRPALTSSSDMPTTGGGRTTPGDDAVTPSPAKPSLRRSGNFAKDLSVVAVDALKRLSSGGSEPREPNTATAASGGLTTPPLLTPKGTSGGGVGGGDRAASTSSFSLSPASSGNSVSSSSSTSTATKDKAEFVPTAALLKASTESAPGSPMGSPRRKKRGDRKRSAADLVHKSMFVYFSVFVCNAGKNKPPLPPDSDRVVEDDSNASMSSVVRKRRK